MPPGRRPAGMAEQHELQLQTGTETPLGHPGLLETVLPGVPPGFLRLKLPAQDLQGSQQQACPQPHVLLSAASSKLSPIACSR